MKLTGTVHTGVGDFSYWIEKLQNYYEKKTGMKFYPGTLNILLEEEYNTPKNDNAIRLEKEEYNGEVSVSIIPCKIFGRNAFILRTDPRKDAKQDNFHKNFSAL